MDGLDLYLLGRRLMKIADASFEQSATERPPLGVMLVLEDVVAHPDSSIREITGRTGFPQSHVSTTVTRLCDRGIVETHADPQDGRRTLVRAKAAYVRSAGRRRTSSADGAIAEALAGASPAEVQEIVGALERLASRLVPNPRARKEKDRC